MYIIFALSAAFATNISIIAIILPILYPFFSFDEKRFCQTLYNKKNYTIKFILFLLLYICFVFAFWPASWSNPIRWFGEINIESQLSLGRPISCIWETKLKG
jgi:hypothetical protein